ncbi:MAG: molybdenum cofactor guanylyltransferase MobA [Aquificaceae bacterium]
MIECFVLAGGQSRRFGEDKLLYKIGDKRTIEHTTETLKRVCDRVCVVAKDVAKFHFLKGVEFIKDLLERQYAIAGLYTALKSLYGEKALVISGDMPLIKEEVIKHLWINSSPPLTLYKIKGKYYHLFAVYYKELLEPLEDYIEKGGKRLMDFVLNFPFKVLEEEEVWPYDPELISFINMNTKEEARLIIELYGRKEVKD